MVFLLFFLQQKRKISLFKKQDDNSVKTCLLINEMMYLYAYIKVSRFEYG